MSNNKDGGPAFPISPDMIMRGHSRMTVEEYEASPLNKECGMTLRDWFAGMAISGVVGTIISGSNAVDTDISHAAYAIADAMLEARG